MLDSGERRPGAHGASVDAHASAAFTSWKIMGLSKYSYPEGPTYTTIMELGPQNHNRDGFLGA